MISKTCFGKHSMSRARWIVYLGALISLALASCGNVRQLESPTEGEPATGAGGGAAGEDGRADGAVAADGVVTGETGADAGSRGDGGGGKICVPNEPACDGDYATTCNSDGTGYARYRTLCGANTTCDAGVCKPHVCPPGEGFCEGQEVKRCFENGLGSTVEATCVNQACVRAGTRAKCQAVCAPGQKQCSGDAVQSCGATGVWDAPVPCAGPMPFCRAGQCVGLGRPAIAAGHYHSCALLSTGSVRCWGDGAFGRLGYGNTDRIGDDETPAGAGDVDVGDAATQITVRNHTCVLLANGAVRCWGYGGSGRLGYGNTDDIGDDETPASAGDVDVGGTVTQIVAGDGHTCALLSGGSVRCWGEGSSGQLGYGNTNDVGDDETPASAGNVDVGGTVIQIAAGYRHSCALLSNGGVRCWGMGSNGQLGYGNIDNIGDNETPAGAGDVEVGGTVVQIAAGGRHTCALLSSGGVRCWGFGAGGWLGYGNTNDIGDDETPASAGDVDIGGTVTQLDAGGSHTCVLLSAGSVRCWGGGAYGRLGHGNTNDIGDDEPPASAGNVDVGGTVTRISTGDRHTCALLSSGGLRCWGDGKRGQLGYGNTNDIGDDETPASAGDVPLL